MSKLFSPIKLAGLELSNRIVIAPMCQYSSEDGCLTDWHMSHLGMLANSGAGHAGGRGDPRRAPRPHHPRLRRALFRRQRGGDAEGDRPPALDRHRQARHPARARRPQGVGAAAVGGRRPAQAGQDPWPTIAPSAIPFGDGWHTPREMTADDIARVRDAFVNAAKRAVRIGFDLIELHYAHGYLAHSFLSPVSNKRTDQYGGSLENRMRFGREVARAVRAVVPKSIALGARITGSDWRDDGITPADAVGTFEGAQGRRASISSTSRRAASPPTPATRPNRATTCRSPRRSRRKPASRRAWSG